MGQDPEYFLRQAIQLAVNNVRQRGGGPFGALVVKNGRVISTGVNSVTTTNDPTAHAEVVAIRAACQALQSFQLEGCEIYTSCEPCPMCLGAIYWSRASRFYFASNRDDAARASFDDALIYDELGLAPQVRSIPGYRLLAVEGLGPFVEWAQSQNNVTY
ncbi:MAG TPA: nucleoside deaminase [Bryobacteraceae bacterium]|nr:nucleoside deaminase [Bryobacteraceae bacterium]